jgi:antitoxin CptB
MNNDIENLKKKLLYRSQYRGNKEMDKLIGSFVETHINLFNIDDLKNLEKFLNIDDDLLYKLYNNKLIKLGYISSKILKLFKNFDYKQ